MIVADQPTIFGSDVIAAVSSANDGDMRFGNGNDTVALQRREAFLDKVGIRPQNVTTVRLSYDTDDFARYREVIDGDKMRNMLDEHELNKPADALITRHPGHALLLSLGDCTGAILYDAKHRILMVSHLGRHSTEIDGAKKSVAYLRQHYNTNPTDVKVWLSPAIGKTFYRLYKKQNKGLHESILEQLGEAGVPSKNIEASKVDTGSDMNYYSHSQFKAGKRDVDGRFAIVAQMRGQGEPAS